MSQEQRDKLRQTQLAYVANDPRWAAHRQKLADAQLARKFTLAEEEVSQIVAMRRKGRRFDYIAEELCVSRDVITRELRPLGVDTSPVRSGNLAKRGKGQWRSFEPAEVARLNVS
jgi:hypothetical protein